MVHTSQYSRLSLPVSVPASTLESGVADIEERGAGEGTAGVVDTRSMSTSTSPPWDTLAELFPFVITGSTTPPLLGDLTLAPVVTRLSTYTLLSLSGDRLVSTWETHHWLTLARQSVAMWPHSLAMAWKLWAEAEHLARVCHSITSSHFSSAHTKTESIFWCRIWAMRHRVEWPQREEKLNISPWL